MLVLLRRISSTGRPHSHLRREEGIFIRQVFGPTQVLPTMACVVGPTDAGMSKFDKGNTTKVYALWSDRINKELRVNVSTERTFQVGHKPSIVAEKVGIFK